MSNALPAGVMLQQVMDAVGPKAVVPDFEESELENRAREAERVAESAKKSVTFKGSTVNCQWKSTIC